MSTFAIGPYLKCFTGKLKDYPYSGQSGIYIMNTIANDDNVLVDIAEKHISALINRNENLNENIRNGALNDKVKERVKKNFKNNIMPQIDSILVHDVCSNILKELQKGNNVSEATYNLLKKDYDDGQLSLFLANTFLYACLYPNKEEETIESNDLPLLKEVNYLCPKCGKSLSKDVRGQTKKEYFIASIFDNSYNLSSNIRKPISLTNNENKIALCPYHYHEYFDNVNDEIYLEMLTLKETVKKRKEAENKVNNLKLDKKLFTIIDRLKDDNTDLDFNPSTNSVYTVKQKIKDQYLAEEIESLVRIRFDKILQMFNNIQSSKFEDIKNKIHKAFVEYYNAGFSQKEIIDYLSNWIISATSLDSDYFSSAKVLVSFFIQLCEVFYAIS